MLFQEIRKRSCIVSQHDVEIVSSMNSQENGEENDLKKTGSIHTTTADELKKYKELLDTGAITETEYNSIKAKLLA
jgi:hypothetical protein